MPYKNRWRNCNTNLTGSSPADQYQRLKLIQKTVRVQSSLYTQAVGALSAYEQPGPATHDVCWNQQSDRVVPSVGRATVPSGSTSLAVAHRGGQFGYGGKSYTQTASRPGAMTPGGVGCDIKHNSYARRLARLKAKGPLKQQGVPVNFGGYLPFNLAYPVYGGKTMKTGLVAGCVCPASEGANVADLYRVGGDVGSLDGVNTAELYPNMTLSLAVGDYVYAILPGASAACYSRALITGVNGDGSFIIQFDNGIEVTQTLGELRMYYNCPDSSIVEEPNLFVAGFLNEIENVFNANCIYPNNPLIQELFS